MTDVVKVALITAVAPIALSFLAALISLLNRWALMRLHLQLNSRLDELVIATKGVGHAEGVAQERQERRDRTLPTQGD